MEDVTLDNIVDRLGLNIPATTIAEACDKITKIQRALDFVELELMRHYTLPEDIKTKGIELMRWLVDLLFMVRKIKELTEFTTTMPEPYEYVSIQYATIYLDGLGTLHRLLHVTNCVDAIDDQKNKQELNDLREAINHAKTNTRLLTAV